jgi:hypothetical protein
MDSFGAKGPATNVTDAIASLALVRALLRRLENKGVLAPEDVSSIKVNALKQVAILTSQGAAEAKLLIEQFN